MIRELLTSLSKGKDLKKDQLEGFLKASVAGKINAVQQGTVLAALNMKGTSTGELFTLTKFLEAESPESIDFKHALDICGTSGSGLPRINTSTISAFILSALEVPIAKHGNKAVSGRFGSFDLLEGLGVDINLNADRLQKLGSQINLAFIYARKFHPVMKHFSEVRKALGFPTIFNLVGPLLNPSSTKVQIIGTAYKEHMETMIQTCKKLGKKHVMVVCAEDGLDEVTLTGKTFVMELEKGKIRKYSLKPASFGIKSCLFDDIAGGDKRTNIRIAREILDGRCESRHLDLVLVNVALALKLSGKVKSLKKGYLIAKDCVESGKAFQQFQKYVQSSQAPSVLMDIALHKQKEVEVRKLKVPLKKFKKKLKASQRDFRESLLKSGVSLIAEIKKSSPSAGVIRKGRFDVKKISQQYEAAGASAISVLTDEKYFGGHLENLQKAQEASSETPLLCKDFILDEYQIYEARKYGADAILLIAALHTKTQLQKFIQVSQSLNMDTLCEVHNADELEKVLETDAQIIGINNRNLHSFKIDLKTTQKLSPKVPKDIILVSESGISSRAHVKNLPDKVDAILVGSSLMKSKDPGKKIEQLIGKKKPLVKICGIQSVAEAAKCMKLGVDMIGLNFVPDSKRRISYQMARKVVEMVHGQQKSAMKVVGVFQNQKLSEVNRDAEMLDLDMIQLSGDEDLKYMKKCVKTVIKGVSVLRKSDIKKAKRMLKVAKYVILDGSTPGSGDAFNHKYLSLIDFPCFIAGGMNELTVKELFKKHQAYGIDTASGVERDGKRDLKKLTTFVNLLKR